MPLGTIHVRIRALPVSRAEIVANASISALDVGGVCWRTCDEENQSGAPATVEPLEGRIMSHEEPRTKNLGRMVQTQLHPPRAVKVVLKILYDSDDHSWALSTEITELPSGRLVALTGACRWEAPSDRLISALSVWAGGEVEHLLQDVFPPFD